MKGFQPTLCTIGGFVVGTTALYILLDGNAAQPVRKQMMRGAGVETDYGEAYDELSERSSDAPVSGIAGPITTTGGPGVQAGGEQHQISRRTNLFSSGNDDAGFRLKLYWRNGYYWQESSQESFWCMSCGKGLCEENQVMRLSNCKTKSKDDARFELIRYKRWGQYRVVDTNLCLQKIGRSRRIALKPCQRNKSAQLFQARGEDEKFDLRPMRASGRCLTNHHHPKAGEEIYAESCRKAHRTKTGYWTKY
ncbi:hypothetical protein ACHAXR_005406 [Thalassiosira sp. AJA248-18]